MPVPKFNSFMRPTLEFLDTNTEPQHIDQIVSHCVAVFNISPTDQEELLPSGKQTVVRNRVHWAVSYLKQAKIVEPCGRGISKITARGKQFLATAPLVITKFDLQKYPEFAAFDSPKNGTQTALVPGDSVIMTEATPEETIKTAFDELRVTLAQDILEEIKKMSPAFFEQLVVQLMLKLGYGGPFPGAGQTLGKTGDGGVDGVINQDKLGMDKIYLQAKRWSEISVSRKEIQAFVGSLVGQQATKGVFIATSSFSKEAREFARTSHGFKVALIDGIELANLMVEHNLGVSIVERYEIKRIDSGYFTEE